MKSQISRDSNRPDKRYSGVYQQQGRMITDADWNELTELAKQRQVVALGDVVASGVPRQGGLEITQNAPGAALEIHAGQLYVDGVVAEAVAAPSDNSPETFGLDGQADLPTSELPSAGATGYKVYADVWERTVVSLEDDDLRDAALHGADTCTRSQTMAQLKWCDAGLDPEDQQVNPPIGDARLSLELRAKGEAQDPCDPCAELIATDARTGNYLFRLEVHDVARDESVSPATTTLTLKWSRENGAEQHRLVPEPPAEFKSGDWVYEFHGDATEKHLGVHLAGGIHAERGELVAAPYPDPLPTGQDRVRRWDGYCVLTGDGSAWSLVQGIDRGTQLVATSGAPSVHGEVELGDLLRVQLENLALTLSLRTSANPAADHVFVAGDYWLAAIREAAHSVGDEVLSAAAPLGVLHHYLYLARVDGAGALLEEDDTDQRQRLAFPSLTDLQAGDIDYETVCASGLFDASHDTVQKALDRVCGIGAEHVAFSNTDPNCSVLTAASTVKEALDALCARGCRVTVGQGGDFPTLSGAISALLERGETDLCLCLLRGDHTHSGELVLEKLPGVEHLGISIEGCGAGTRLSLSKGTFRFVGLDSVDLRDLDIHLADDARLLFEANREVILESIRISGPARSEAPVEISGADSVHLAGNDITFVDSGPALALVLHTASDKTTLVDNRIVGIVSLYGVPGLGIDAQQLTDLADTLSSVNDIASSFAQVSGTLALTRNQFARLVLGEPMLAAITDFLNKGTPMPGPFRALFMTDNQFFSDFNRFLAQDCRLNSNIFAGADKDLAQVVGMTGIYVGNHSDNVAGEIMSATVRSNAATRDDLNTLTILNP